MPTIMKTNSTWTCAALAALTLATGVLEAQQRPDRDSNQRGRPGGGFGRSPLIAALDANADGIIDAVEIENAVAALKSLDKNQDGRLSPVELRSAPPENSGRGGLAGRLMEFDENKDGKVSKAELPARMERLMGRLDSNKDGFLTREEIQHSAGRSRNGDGARPGRGEGRSRRDN